MAVTAEQLSALVEEGLTTKQIGDRLGYNFATISHALRQHGIENPQARGRRIRNEAILADLAGGMSVKRIALKYGMKPTSIYNVTWRSGTKVLHHRDVSAAFRDELLEMVAAGKTTREIATALNVATSTVHKRCTKLGVKITAQHPRNGDRLPYGADKVRYSRIAAGWTFAQIAAEEGVTRQAIQAWAKRRGLRQLASGRSTTRNRWYDYEEVAVVARGAMINDQFPGIAVAGHFGVSEKSANQLIRRARLNGFDIPKLEDRRPGHWRKAA